MDLPEDFAKILKNQAQKIACLVHQNYLIRRKGGWAFTNDVPTLAKQQERMLNAAFGEDEAFRNELTPGFGTAFLVSKQLAFTAAHCICDENSELNTRLVQATKLVFDFHEVKEKPSDYFFNEEQVRTVTVVAYQHFRAPGRKTAYSEWTDWVLLKLDKEVTYDPLPLDLNKIVSNIELYMLGHPNGQPLKFTYNGKLEGNTESDTSGFLQSVQEGGDILTNEYSFLHLTFQEFFTARYLVRLIENNLKEATACIQKVKFDPRFKVVIWFTAGL